MRTYHIYIDGQYVDTVQGRKKELHELVTEHHFIDDPTRVTLTATLAGAGSVGYVRSSNPFGCGNHVSQRVDSD